MPKKLLIHFWLLLLMMTFTQNSFSEASEKPEESNKEVAAEHNEEEKEYLDNYAFVTTIIGFAGKSTPNPLENMYFYNHGKPGTITDTATTTAATAEETALKKTHQSHQSHQNYAYTLDLHRCSFIIPKFCKEAIIRVYKKTN